MRTVPKSETRAAAGGFAAAPGASRPQTSSVLWNSVLCLLSSVLLSACSPEQPEASGTLAQLSARMIEEFSADTPGFRESVARFCPSIPARSHDECGALLRAALQSDFFRQGLQDILSDLYTPREMEYALAISSLGARDLPDRLARINAQEAAFVAAMTPENAGGLAAANYADSARDRLIRLRADLLAQTPEKRALAQSETYRQKMTEIYETLLSPQEMENILRYTEFQNRPDWAAEYAAIDRKRQQEITRVSDLIAQAVRHFRGQKS